MMGGLEGEGRGAKMVIFDSSSTDKRKFLAFINESFNASAFKGVTNVGE